MSFRIYPKFLFRWSHEVGQYLLVVLWKLAVTSLNFANICFKMLGHALK